ncbi:MAG TPA: carboxypeptidase regulatory-like domain-containing protein [Terracidiphilus sp.]|nr:carboxypeptidase regulatory-like domain-containing protein [Terracidiphilus sp.]
MIAKTFPRGLKPRHFKAVCAIVLAMACVAPAQTGSSAHTSGVTAAVYGIAGTVVNAVTGQPVRGATVAVLAEEDSRRIASAQSGNDGRFDIPGLAAGMYQLSASKRGYSSAYYDEHEQFSSAIVTGEGQNTSSLVFRLTPGAVLRGVVTADGGDPLEGAQVMLFKKPQGHEPEAKIAQVDSTVTDDTGAYEFSNLGVGEYLLAVKAEPWYAMHRAGGGSRQAEGNRALDVAYPITFFDSTTDEASASPIALTGGSRAEADVSLHAVPALRLVVEAPRKQDGSAAVPELKQTIFGTPLSSRNADFMDAITNGRAEFTGMAPGQYEITQGDPPRVVELDANTSQQVEPGAGIPAVAVSGTLQTATGGPLTGEAVVTLEPADSSQGLKPMVSEFNRGSFSISAVPSGKWKLRVEIGRLQAPVISIAVGGRTHSGNLVAVQDRALTMVVKVSAGGTRVEGFANEAGKGKAGVLVLLVPRDAAAFPELVRRDQSNSDGSFAMRDAVPGQYTVVAIEDGWTLDWTRPEVIGRYLPGGIAVTVTDTLDKAIRLSGPVPVQKR